MTRRERKLRALFRVVVLLGTVLGIQAAAGCDTAPLNNAPGCSDGSGTCSCAEDPFQPTCRGFNDRPDGGFEATVGGDTGNPDTSTPDTSTTDAADDGSTDAADEPD